MVRWWICCLLAVHLVAGVRSFDGCGIRKTFEREQGHNANQASRGEWPWHAGVFYWMNATSLSYACGGSIIVSNFILTAAHCTYLDQGPDYEAVWRQKFPYKRSWDKCLPATHDKSPQVRPLESFEILVRVGLTNLQKLDHEMQQSTVAEIIRHEQFNVRTLQNDIALLKLTTELEITDYVIPICLWSESESHNKIVEEEAYVVGWGWDENHELEHTVTSATILTYDICLISDWMLHDIYANEGTFCVKFENGTSLRAGWGGGGLSIKVEEQWMLRGIISKGETVLSNPESTVLFTELGYYIPWIQKSTAETSGNAKLTVLDVSRPGNPAAAVEIRTKHIDMFI